ncbi:peroxiredoxin [Humidisolicoccus flavus]|uniref:peroxiredoxin n=1 Tax=Humidisolicoccus flavus TaxID=3111414 RepID=UPI0032473119
MTHSIGAIAPDFSLPNQYGETVSLSELLDKKPVVLVFFPLAFTGICTGELCELRDNLELFAHADVELVAISVDSKGALRAFAESEGYDFMFLSDFWPHGAVADAYGVFLQDRGTAGRATFVIDQDRTIHAKFETAPGQARDFASYESALRSLRK